MFELVLQFAFGALIFVAGYKLRRSHEEKRRESLENQKHILQQKLKEVREEKRALVSDLIPKFIRRRKNRRASFYIWK